MACRGAFGKGCEVVARGAELAILFADIAGSTRLYERLGDGRARRLVARAVGAMTDVTERHEGRVVKTIGDEVMSLFPSADHAANAAVEMQDAMVSVGADDNVDVAIRVGFHQGPVLIEQSDVFGDAVNVAAHVTKQAKPGQILISGTTQERMSERWRPDTRPIARVGVKGRQDQIELFEVIWQADDMTMLRAPPVRGHDVGERLVLLAGNRRIEIGALCPAFAVGRDERNDVVIADTIVSRHHAKVEFRNGRFVLTDQSANGTFIVPDKGSASFVHRDSVIVAGKGLIGLGAQPEAGTPTTISYEQVSGSAAAAAPRTGSLETAKPAG
jgi:class 3 adenylate cyclase